MVSLANIQLHFGGGGGYLNFEVLRHVKIPVAITQELFVRG